MKTSCLLYAIGLFGLLALSAVVVLGLYIWQPSAHDVVIAVIAYVAIMLAIGQQKVRVR